MKKPLLSELTLREKIGQMLLPYQYHVYCDTTVDPVRKRTEEEVKEYMQKEQLGVMWADQVDLTSTMEEWWEEQGKIFQGVIDGGVYSVMVGHEGFPACDDSKLKGKHRPSTVSKKVVTDLLKGEMGFKGVVITDDIIMTAHTSCYDSYDELIIDLANAGNDVILGVYPGAGDIIEKAVKEGVISESRIDDACQRVLDMKEKVGLFNGDHFEPPYKAADVTPHTRDVNKKIAEKAITLLYDNQGILPVDQKKIKNVTIICSTHADNFFKDLDCMKALLEERGMNVRLQRRLSSYDEMEEIDATSDLIIYAAYVGSHAPKGGLTFFGEECGTFHYAFNRGMEKSIAVSMGYPYLHHGIMAGAETFINTYGSSPELIEAFIKCIFGEIPFEGVSPVKIVPDPVLML